MIDRRALTGLDLGGEDLWANQRLLFEFTRSTWHEDLLATRGNRLALFRTRLEAEDQDAGPSEVEYLEVDEVDTEGRFVAIVLLDPDELDAAYAELDARYEAGDGAAHPAHRAVMRAFTAAVASRDWEPVFALCAPAFVEYDHRGLAVLGTTRGAAAWAENFRTLVDLAPDTIYRVDHFRSGARGFCSVGTWHGSREGGPYEIPLIAVLEMDEQDRLARADIYDLDQLDQARARFDELKNARSQRFANAASATVDPVIACMVAHDWEGFVQLFSEDFRISDRRRVVQLELDRDQYVAFTREVADGRAIRAESRGIATRGERLALTHPTYVFTDEDVGPSEIAFLILIQVDDRGRIVAYVRFDLEDLDAAYTELDARWATGEAAAHPLASRWLADYRRFFAARDWKGMAAIMAPDLVSHSHRLVSWGTLHGPAGLVSTLQSQMELAPDTQVRFDHVRACAGGLLLEYAWHGTREGGAFENALIAAVEIDALGRARRIDVWEAEQLDQAQARFAEIAARRASGASASARFANAATRAVDRGTAALAARDWEGFAALMAAGFRHYDRTRVAQLETDGQQWLASFRQMVEMTSSRPTQQLLATRGDRLALFRVLWRGAQDDVGPSEIDWLLIIEVDGRGDHTAVVAFDPEDLDAAYAELDARYEAGEGAACGRAWAAWRGYLRALAERDWTAMSAQLAPELVVDDHRPLGWETLRVSAHYIDSLRSLVELAPDARLHLDHLRLSSHGILCVVEWQGTREGGAFEVPKVGVFEIDGAGRICRMDAYDLDQLDQARARFDAIGASKAPDPLRIPPNASTRANDRWWANAEAEDWDAVRALTAMMVFEDRRRLIRIAGGSELLLADTRHLWNSGWRPTRILLATAGDRLSLERMLWSLADEGQVSEIEVLKVAEIDAEGRIVAYIIFDADNRAAASAELIERYARRGADEIPAAWFEFWRAWNDHDLGRLRTLLPTDYYFHDHRRTGIGRVEGEAYIASLAALYELSPDVRLEPLYWVIAAAHGRVGVMRWVGTNAEGGDFEAVFAGLSLYRGERPVGAELFEIVDLDAALARFEELRAQLPPEGDR